jgi:hypothetical protein
LRNLGGGLPCPTLLNTDAGARAVQDMLPDLEARAAAMDEDDSLAW